MKIINEEDQLYVDNSESRIFNILQKKAKNISKWIKLNILPFNIKKEAIFKSRDFLTGNHGFYYHFSINDDYYILYFMILIEWSLEDKIKSCFIKLEKFNNKNINILGKISENMKLSEFSPEKLEYMIKKINTNENL